MVICMAMILVLTMTACGKKSKDDVVKDLNSKIEEISGYKAKADLTIKTGDKEQTYNIEILYKKPSYYKVSLANVEKGQSQIILRNDEGVFVLTPALNKSFKFQSDWPLDSSQVYLYESLVKDILLDKNATFTANDDTYEFETKTNYQNSTTLPTQKIVFNKKDLTPKLVQVLDADKNVTVEVKFSKLDVNAKIDDKAFDVSKNMKAAQESEVPTLAQDDNSSFSVLYPSDDSLPDGVELKSEEKVKSDDSKRFVLSYGGEKSFTLIQEAATVAETSTPIQAEGEPVDLGRTIGAMTAQSISWSVDGVDYLLASEDLSQEEMITIASSVGETAEK